MVAADRASVVLKYLAPLYRLLSEARPLLMRFSFESGPVAAGNRASAAGNRADFGGDYGLILRQLAREVPAKGSIEALLRLYGLILRQLAREVRAKGAIKAL